MVVKKTTYNGISEAIKISFLGDKDLHKFYDPNVKVDGIEEIVNDIKGKLLTYKNSEYRVVMDKKSIAGYFVFSGSNLISFALAIQYRVRKYLREFMSLIKQETKIKMECLLWISNVRAIRWLEKNDFKITFVHNKIVKLCQ